jgi:glucosamine--fructose-6-phosphate aminotransferase (isomerizing)
LFKYNGSLCKLSNLAGYSILSIIMCGIVGYTGPREAFPVVFKGLKRLEYRGYDSSGVALLNNGKLNVFKKKGKVTEIEENVIGKDLQSHIGIGHTRWATHGEPSDRNAHPHQSQSGNWP